MPFYSILLILLTAVMNLQIPFSGSINNNAKKRRLGIIIILTLMGVFILGFVCIFFLVRSRGKFRRLRGDLYDEKDLELPIFYFNAIANATSNFSDNNKIGEGGYGPVYKVKLFNILKTSRMFI